MRTSTTCPSYWVLRFAFNKICCYVSVTGVELLKQYKHEVDKFEADRQELANAEKLFDLPITMYQELIQVQKELKGLEQIYFIYQEQKVSELLFTRTCSMALSDQSDQSGQLFSVFALMNFYFITIVIRNYVLVHSL